MSDLVAELPRSIPSRDTAIEALRHRLAVLLRAQRIARRRRAVAYATAMEDQRGNFDHRFPGGAGGYRWLASLMPGFRP